MDKSNKKSISNTLKNIIRGNVYFIVMCVLFAFSIVSLLFEIVYSNSVTATAVALVENCSFLKRHCPYLSFDFLKNVPIILRAGVILEIVKILGFGTVLFGIVQALMDKKTFGVPYANIIKKQYRYYQWIFIIHLISTVMCIGFSAAGASEGALVTLAILLLGFLYLWIIIDDLVFHTTNREKIAITELMKDLENDKSSNEELLRAVQNIAKEASKENNIEKSNITACFAESFITYCQGIAKNNSGSCSVDSIRDISSVWETALIKVPELQKLRYAASIIALCCQRTNVSQAGLIVLSSGLELYLFTQVTTFMGNARDLSFEEFLAKLSNQLYSVNNSLFNHLEDEHTSTSLSNNNIRLVQGYLNTVYTVLVFTNIQNGHLRLTSELLKTATVDKNLRVYNDALIETVCATMPLTTLKEYEDLKAIIKHVIDKLGLH